MTRDFAADDLSGAARMELVDEAGLVVHVVGAAPLPAVQLPPGALARVTPAWRFRVFDDAGRLLADLPARAYLPH